MPREPHRVTLTGDLRGKRGRATRSAGQHGRLHGADTESSGTRKSTELRHGSSAKNAKNANKAQAAARTREEPQIMAPVVTMKQLLESGVHFGHQTRRWNPKMKRYIFTERNGIYIIDLQQS